MSGAGGSGCKFIVLTFHLDCRELLTNFSYYVLAEHLSLGLPKRNDLEVRS